MRLSLFAAGWGRTAFIKARGLPAVLDMLKEHKFDGFEATAEELGATFQDKLDACKFLKERGMRLIYSAYTTWPGYEGLHPGFTTPAEHLDMLERELACAAELEAAFPDTLAHVNVHAGCDSFTDAEADAYYEKALSRIDSFLSVDLSGALGDGVDDSHLHPRRVDVDLHDYKVRRRHHF